MVEVTQDGWTDASTPAPHGEPVLAEFREWNSPNGAIKQQVVWWWEGEWRTYTNTEDKAYCDRWRPLPRIASLQAENTHWCSVANQRALDLAAERDRVRGLEAERAAMIEAINDAIRRPLGVVPKSAEQWYMPL